ncbi:MAG: FtsX-like permease family protein, partial [Bacteroidales bacterium]|nr:FtsX-like permease family protein [Bacteroidales bacterium]
EVNSVGSTYPGYPVVGVVKDVRPWAYNADCNTAWIGSLSEIGRYSSGGTLSVRLKPSYAPEQWVKDNKEEMLRSFKFGNFYVKSVSTYNQMGDRTWISIKADSEKHIKYALLLFFLVNLALGVAGTYYLQTRSRSHDAGLMKAYGSTGRRVFGMLVGEAMIVTVLGWIIGCFAYLHYALKEGVSSGLETGIDVFPTDCWVSDFSTHFIVVSLAVLVVLAVIVLIGVSFPARRIARVNPVDALRDE